MAIRKLGEIMAHELAGHQITVNIVQPGHILTAAELQMGLTQEQAELHGKRIPAQRMGRPDDIADSIVKPMENEEITKRNRNKIHVFIKKPYKTLLKCDFA